MNFNLTHLLCARNKLTSLPSLDHNLFLKELDCEDNSLTRLPSLLLNKRLESLLCSWNPLSELPSLQHNAALVLLSCVHNHLTDLPSLKYNARLKRLHYSLGDDEPDADNEIINKIGEVRAYQARVESFCALYHALKWKPRLRDWLWKLREERARTEMHPLRIQALFYLEDSEEETAYSRVLAMAQQI